MMAGLPGVQIAPPLTCFKGCLSLPSSQPLLEDPVPAGLSLLAMLEYYYHGSTSAL